MRQKLLREGAGELTYEIRDIVKKADLLQRMGMEILWENIGDPIQKHNQVPLWMREIVASLAMENKTYGYCHSKGELSTRSFLAKKNNALGGVQITTEDILFFNGLGDAIAKIYEFLLPSSRVIGPSPAYSTHSSGEAAHANTHPLTYKLDPDNSWYPDLDDLRNKIKYNPSIVGILIINPDNPTGMVYPREIMEEMIAIAKEFDLFVICDEIYNKITYNDTEAVPLAKIIGDVPGIALKGISKELPWPGSRCGWAEYYNRCVDSEFSRLCETLDNAKMVEVCSTKLPQLAIPIIMGDERYMTFRNAENIKIGKRSHVVSDLLGDVKYLRFNKTNGAFYNTIIFKDGVLNKNQSLKIKDPEKKKILTSWLEDKQLPADKQFVYYLLAAKGVCVVPISSFCSDLMGFRVTLLEEDETILLKTFSLIKEAVIEYCES